MGCERCGGSGKLWHKTEPGIYILCDYCSPASCERCGGTREIGEEIGGRGERWEPCPDCSPAPTSSQVGEEEVETAAEHLLAGHPYLQERGAMAWTLSRTVLQAAAPAIEEAAVERFIEGLLGQYTEDVAARAIAEYVDPYNEQIVAHKVLEAAIHHAKQATQLPKEQSNGS